MREYRQRECPDFLPQYDIDDETCVAVQATIGELAEKGFRVHSNEPLVPKTKLKQLARTYGDRRIFCVLNFDNRCIVDTNCFFIEVSSQEEANTIGLLLDIPATETTVEIVDPRRHDNDFDGNYDSRVAPELEGFRSFCIQ